MKPYGIVKLTQANFDHDHMYLSTVMDLFPSEAIGGPSEEQRSTLGLTLHYGGRTPVVTDIAGDKKIFRRRGWLRDFFSRHDLDPDDEVVIELVGDCEYHIYPRR